jgi:plasmid stabilization system protein ParE
MELEIIWSKKAASGYSKILKHLDENWTAKEVESFEEEMKSFFNTLSKQPYILKESKKKGLRRDPINKLTLLTYRVNRKENQVQLINIRGARQKPLK